VTSIVVVVVALVAGLAMAWAIGANSNSPPFAPAVAANALPTLRAALLIGIFAGAGAILQGGNISGTIGSSLVRFPGDASMTPLVGAAALLVAAASIVIGVRTGYPMPSAFATTGAVIGAGLGAGGLPATDTYLEIGVFWLLIAPFAGGIAYGTATLLRDDRVPERVGVPLLGGIAGLVIANMSIPLVPVEGGARPSLALFVSQSLAGGYDLAMLGTSLLMGVVGYLGIRALVGDDVDAGIRRFLIALGALVAFSSGGSQVGLATGPLETLFENEFMLPPWTLLVLGGLAMLVGAWTGAPRLLQAVAREYSALGVRRSIAALVPGFIIAQTAIALGIPISFNHVIISSVIGSGLVEGSGGVSGRKIGYTLTAWLATLVLSVAVAFGLYRGLAAIPGVG
jgi:phosphate/sulfate permease